MRIYFTIIGLLITTTAIAAPIPKQTLVKGEAVSIEADYDIGEVAISDHEICDFMVTETRREIYLNPREEGVATLTIWDIQGGKRDVVPVEVYAVNMGGVEREAELIFKGTKIKMVQKGGQRLLSGVASNRIEYEQAVAFASKYDQIENRVQLSKGVIQDEAKKIEHAIGTPGIKVRNVEGKLILEGVAYSQSAVRRALEIARLHQPGIINLIDLKETGRRPGRDQLVKLNFYFVEIKREALRSFGVRWAPGSMPKTSSESSGLLGGVSQLGTSLIGFVFNLIPKLKVIRERGNARLLDQASLIIKSGESGDFFSGTEVPYYAKDEVRFKNVGIDIHAEPIAAGGSVDLIIQASLSSMAANIEGGIDRRRVQTNAYVRAGQAVALANMVSNREVTTYNRHPSNIDTSTALFDLALSKDFQSGRSEFIVFIEPEVMSHVSPAEEELQKYLEMENDMILTRSKKEYEEHLIKSGYQLPSSSSGSTGGSRPRRRRKQW